MRRTSEKPFECTTRGGEAEHDVARLDVGARQERAALGGADREAGEIIVAIVVEARHLGRLAADERASGLPATVRDARDEARSLRGIELAGREIVEEEQRLGALAPRDR